MEAMLSANAVSAKYSAMKLSDKKRVSDFIFHIEGARRRKASIVDHLVALSMNLPDIIKPRNAMTDDEMEDFIDSVRAEEHATRSGD